MTYLVELKLAQEQIRPIGPSTQSEYDRVWARLEGRHWRDYADSRQIKSKSSLAVLRAAWRRGIGVQIQNEIEAFRAMQANSPHDADPTHEERDQVIRALYAQLDDEIRGVGCLPAADPSPTSTGRRHSPRKTSKRQSLNGLPGNWRSQLIRAMNNKEDQLALMVIALTGARPEELRLGVRLKIETDQQLTFHIQGAKVSAITGGGQDWRELTVKAREVLDSDLVYELMAYIHEHQITTIRIDPKNAFQKRLERIRNKMAQYNPVWRKVSSYSIRHQFGADVKGDKGVHHVDISRAMGHTSDRTKQHYGHALQKRGESGITKVRAATPIKVHRKSAASQVFLSKTAKRPRNRKSDSVSGQE